MAAPSSPFTTSAAVAYLSQIQLRGKTDFDVDTTPTKTQVDNFITWVSGQVELQFQLAGYKVPLQEISGETWPTSQTVYLQLITTMGAAAHAIGHSQRPTAGAGGRVVGTGNQFQDLFNVEMRKIWDNITRKPYMRFRAAYYHSTPAENLIGDFRGPTTDFMEGKYDPQRFLTSYEAADQVMAIRESLRDQQIAWDYLYTLFDLNKGLGRSIYEGVTAS